ncbi:hypothetical protein [Clostridium tetanomorphum]|uniref:Uncharacterized protein n=1 Tax=Clostridium tetanomorphum TaxID=1553 RepID=A0A923E8N2_CLOTT|nr:hypothetical protein [Clostridium tetanomorphum]MBC2397114.1 hypothetical protein [Clostridium tetanomorphum]NRZ99042.1 hypothetical protein [Clostridium tetanomorphum]
MVNNRLGKTIINYLIIFAIFDAYSYNINDTFGITLVLFSIGLIFVTSFVYLKNIGIIKNKLTLCVILCIMYLLVNFILNGGKITSLLFLIFYLLFLMISYRKVKVNEFNKIVNVYIVVTTILSVYGIYQFFGRLNNWPLVDLYFENMMNKGFNWSNQTIIFNKLVWRSNAIYKEPSFFSQFTALTCYFCYLKFIYEKNNVFILILLINLLGLILSFAGTGVLILFSFFVFELLFRYKSKFRTKILYFMIFIIFIGILSCFLDINKFIEYFISRTNEIFNNRSSGGIRFIGPFIALKESLKENFFIGNGIGSRIEFIEGLGLSISTISAQSTVARIGIDLGMIGIVFWFILIYFSVNKKNLWNKYYVGFIIFILVQMFNGEYFLSTSYWPFLYFINCSISKDG